MFARILNTLPSAQLVLVGRGEDEADIRSRVAALGIGDHVQLLGVRDDVPAILSALDVFIFPSLKEGLANATVEAQASGARCLLSTGVPELARISPTRYSSLWMRVRRHGPLRQSTSIGIQQITESRPLSMHEPPDLTSRIPQHGSPIITRCLFIRSNLRAMRFCRS